MIKPNFIVLLFSVLMLQACAFTEALEDGYQFGDLTRSAVNDLGDYCTATSPVARTAARTAFMVATGLPFPVNPCRVYDALKTGNDATSSADMSLNIFQGTSDYPSRYGDQDRGLSIVW